MLIKSNTLQWAPNAHLEHYSELRAKLIHAFLQI